MRPVIGLLGATEHLDSVPYVAVRRPYVEALTEVAGCDVVVLAGPVHDPAHYLCRFDGLVLGGHQSDVEPARYGGTGQPDQAYDRERDGTALALLRAAAPAGIPVLGICRGLQELNVSLGGTLRDLGDRHSEDLGLPRDEQYLSAHDVRCTPGGVLHGIVGVPVLAVNSLHHQAIDRLAADLRPEAVAADGVVEAVSRPGPALCLAVQWHPEWYAASDPAAKAIFQAFGSAAERRTVDAGSPW